MCTRKLLWEPRNRLNEDRLAGWSNEPANWIVDWLSPLSTSTELQSVRDYGVQRLWNVRARNSAPEFRLVIKTRLCRSDIRQRTPELARSCSELPSRNRQRYFTHHTSYADKATQLEEATTEGIRDGAGGGQHRKLNNTSLPAEPLHSSWRKASTK